MKQNFIDFVRELFNSKNNFIPLHAPVFLGNEEKYLKECIDSTFVSSVGKFVDEFELAIARYTGSKMAVACVNGTSALHLALKMSGVQHGSEVITQPLTFIATANAIKYCEAEPVFLDVDRTTMGLSPDSLKKFLENETYIDEVTNKCVNKSTHNTIIACVPMHTFGHPCRIDKIVEICNQYHIKVIEDAAESLGSFYLGKHTGTFGEIGVLSFNGNKIITTGGGGMLLFNDVDLAKKAKHLTTQAKIPHPWEFVHDEIGFNYRMPNINAALGVAQLEMLEEFVEAKRRLASEYKAYFNSTDISFFSEPEYARSNYWLNLIILKDRNARDNFLEETNRNRVMTRPVWELLNRLEMFKACQSGDLKNAEWLYERVVNIPSSVIKNN